MLPRLLPRCRRGGGGGAMPLCGCGFASADVRRLLLSMLLTLAGRRTDMLRVGGGGGADTL